ncbi:MAG: hypothetical protein HUU60_12110 [Armatimonadetes bacterium]|nr:hypothetical protein [Armatimonadota bacterium]
MSKKSADKIVARWRSGAVHEAKESELIAVLKAYGVKWRWSKKRHIVLEMDSRLTQTYGDVVSLSYHHQGNQGKVSPKSISKLLQVLDDL